MGRGRKPSQLWENFSCGADTDVIKGGALCMKCHEVVTVGHPRQLAKARLHLNECTGLQKGASKQRESTAPDAKGRHKRPSKKRGPNVLTDDGSARRGADAEARPRKRRRGAATASINPPGSGYGSSAPPPASATSGESAAAEAVAGPGGLPATVSRSRSLTPSWVVVHCPGDPEINLDSSPPSVRLRDCEPAGERTVTGATTMYLGATVRMQAAAKLPKGTQFIVVGGSPRYTTATVPAAATKRNSKLLAMRAFLMLNGHANKNIVMLRSEADTTGNLHAVRRFLERQERLPARLGILTNMYHIPRAMRLAVDILSHGPMSSMVCVPLIAEAFGTRAGAQISGPALAERFARELRGLGDWQVGCYKWQHKPTGAWEAVHLSTASEEPFGLVDSDLTITALA